MYVFIYVGALACMYVRELRDDVTPVSSFTLIKLGRIVIIGCLSASKTYQFILNKLRRLLAFIKKKEFS